MNASVIKRLNQVLLFVMMAVMLDTCVTAVRSSSRSFGVTAGEETIISGKLDGAIFPSPVKGDVFSENRIKDPVLLAGLLRAEPSPSPVFTVRFIERNGRIWRAVLRVHPDARTGEYPLHVLQPNEAQGAQGVYTVNIYPDTAAKDRAAPSFSIRFLGIAPWWIGLAIVPLVIALMAVSWRVSRSEERRLRQQGIGVIYKLARQKGYWELIAGLGTADGISLGERVLLTTKDMHPIADVRINSVHPDHLTAEVGLDVPVTPDCYLLRTGVAPTSPGARESDGRPCRDTRN